MTPAMEAYDEVDGAEGFDDLESTAEAFPFRPGRKVFAPGGLRTAMLNTPKGQATLNLPATVATVTQLRTVEQALNANTQRVNAVQTELARVRRQLALRRPDPQGLNTMSMLLLMKLSKDFKAHKHATLDAPPTESADSSGFSSLLPLLMLQPGLFGGGSALSSTQLSSTQPSTTQDAMSPLMMMIFMEALD